MSERSLNPVADMAENSRIENLLPTPFFSHVLKNVDSLNAELRNLILDRERTRPSASKSNIGGWQSEADFLTWGDVAGTLGHYLATAVELPANCVKPSN